MKNTQARLTPEALLAKYTPIVFRTVGAYLSDPEDIKEVVNDSFFEFCRSEERFDTEKYSYAVLLTMIAKRNAIDRLRRNGRRPKQNSFDAEDAEPEAPLDLEGTVTDRLALEDALGRLDEDELELIRAKYYNGMTLHEIAKSMNLPYETVKKRHQRSIKKLRLILLLTILIALLLAGCAAYVAQKMGIIPGFGVSANENAHFYSMLEPMSVQVPDTDLTITFTSVTCEGNTLAIQFTLTDADGSDYRNPYEDDPQYANRERYYVSNAWEDSSASIGDFVMEGTNYHSSYTDPDTGLTVYDAEIYEYTKGFDKIVGGTEDPSAPVVTLRLKWDFYVADLTDFRDEDGFMKYLESTSYDVTAELPLTEISAETMDEYAYEYVDGQGGLAAIPRLEDGRLIVALYPIQPDVGHINPSLSYHDVTISSYGISLSDGEELPDSTIYAVAEDGTVLVGTCSILDDITYDLNSHYYFEWDFGPAEPGNYTIVVPYLLKAYGPSSGIGLTMDPKNGTVSSRAVRFDGGTLRLTDITPTTYEELEEAGYDTSGYRTDTSDEDLLWIVGAEAELDAPDETVVFVSCEPRLRNPVLTALGIQDDTPFEERRVEELRLSYPTDTRYTLVYQWFNGQRYYDASEGKTLWLYIDAFNYQSNHINMGTGIVARWDHRFELEITVE